MFIEVEKSNNFPKKYFNLAKLQFQELLNVLVQLHGLPLVYNREGYISLEKLLEILIINLVFSFSFLPIVTYFSFRSF